MNEEWTLPADPPVLTPGEAHIWRFRADRSDADVEHYQRILSPEEGVKASRFRNEIDRVRFINRRGVLRTILSRYLSELPEDVHLNQNEPGRPEVIPKDPRSALTFSTSQSHEWSLCAIASDGRIGVDIELVDREFRYSDVVRHYFSPAETEAVNSFNVAAQPEAFFRIWTQKEAYVKALGRGLLAQLPDLASSFVESDCSLQLFDNEGKYQDWYRRTFIPATRYLASVFTSQSQRECRFFEYSP